MAYAPLSPSNAPADELTPGIFIHDDTHPRAAVVHIFGEATFADVENLESIVVGAVRIGRPVVIDLHECTYLDCAALGVIVRAAKNLRDLLRLAVPRERQSYRILELVGLTRVLHVFESLEEAISPPGTATFGTLRSV